MLAVADVCADDAFGDCVKKLWLVLGSGIGFTECSPKNCIKIPGTKLFELFRKIKKNLGQRIISYENHLK